MFEPGKSGNPGGRPKMTPEQRKRWQALAEACLDKLEEMANDPETPKQLIVKITELAADRGWGKAIQAVDFSAQEGTKVDFSFVAPPTSTE